MNDRVSDQMLTARSYNPMDMVVSAEFAKEQEARIRTLTGLLQESKAHLTRGGTMSQLVRTKERLVEAIDKALSQE